MSAVRKLAPEPIARPRPRPRPRTRVRRKAKHSTEYIHYNTRPYRTPFKVLFTVVLIFACGLATAFSFAYLQHMRLEIDRTRTAISQQRAENAATSAEIAQHLSVDDIAQIARERLNMGPPDISQIVRINVPPQSYVVQSEAPARTVPEGMWQSAWWHIRNWIGV